MCVTLQASVLPVLHFDAGTLKLFQDYVSAFERTDLAEFNTRGKLWIDGQPAAQRTTFESGKIILEPRENRDFANGSIHHFTGVIHINGTNIEAVRKVMQDYSNYPRYFGPDIAAGSGQMQADSTPGDEHYYSRLLITQATLWINVAYQTLYDTHYLRLDSNRWVSQSTSLSVRELLNAADPRSGTYPEGEDHGFLWKTNTYWFVRNSKNGLDLEANSITVSRPIPTGFGWWGTKRTRYAVEKMINDLKTALGQK